MALAAINFESAFKNLPQGPHDGDPNAVDTGGSPNPGGRMDSGRSWAIAGRAIATASAAPPTRMFLVRGSIAGNIGLDRLNWDFIRVLRQKEQSADKQDDNNNQENVLLHCGKHKLPAGN